MSKINRLFSLMNNRDVRGFVLYSLIHPWTILSKRDAVSLPSYILENDIVNIDKIESKYGIKKLNLPCILDKEVNSKVFENTNIIIHLAGINDDVDIEHIDWNKEYSDPEDVAALHRFFWVYRIVWENRITNDSKLNDRLKKIIYSWIDKIESKSKNEVHPEVWQTYSVVERLISWAITLGLTETDQDFDTKIVSSIIRQLDYIQKNFEYYGEEFTSNHFCNDGRGLYICGSVLGIESFVKLGKNIIKDMLIKIVPDSVFLREGSTHYQFLITKWMCDCLWIARECGDNDFADWISSRLKGLKDGCRYFMVNGKEGWEIPLIGDISPDLTPSWIIGTPWVAHFLLHGKLDNEIPETIGYHSILGDCNATILNGMETEYHFDGSNDWQKVDTDTFTVYVHVNNSLYPNNLTGHFHHDSGSIVAFYKGIAILADSGRLNYKSDGVGIWMKSAFGHNVFIIDGENSEPDMRAFYSMDFLKDYLGDSPKITKCKNVISSVTYGGNRLKGIDTHIRTVEVEKDKIIVKDTIEGTHSHKGFLIYHIDNKWCVTETDGVIYIENGLYRFVILSDNCELKIRLNDGGEEYYAYCSKEYGILDHCTLIVGEIRFKGSYEVTTRIERV